MYKHALSKILSNKRGKSFFVIEIQQKQRQQQQAFACETYIAVFYECIYTIEICLNKDFKFLDFLPTDRPNFFENLNFLPPVCDNCFLLCLFRWSNTHTQTCTHKCQGRRVGKFASAQENRFSMV